MTILNFFRVYFCTFLLLVSMASLQAQESDSSQQANGLDAVPSGAYSVDITHASVVWKVSHLGFSTYVGRFNDFSADLNLVSDDFSKSSVDVDIKVDSIDTAYPFPDEKDFNKKLSVDWFKSETYPSIIFKSKSVSELIDGKAKVTGDLVLLGQTHEVVLDVVFNKGTASHPFKKVPVVGFSATTSIDRTVWGFTKYAPNIGAQVEIEIEGEFVKSE